MEKKITKADRFKELLTYSEVSANAEMVDFINHELDLLKKKSENKKVTKESEEFIALKDKVADILDSTPKTITDIIKSSDDLAGLNTQKLVPVMKALIADGIATRTEEKGRALFSIA